MDVKSWTEKLYLLEFICLFVCLFVCFVPAIMFDSEQHFSKIQLTSNFQLVRLCDPHHKTTQRESIT